MGITVKDWPEVQVRRDAKGRVIKYAVPTRNGKLVWVYVPYRYRTEGLSYIGDDLLQTLPLFLRRQAE